MSILVKLQMAMKVKTKGIASSTQWLMGLFQKKTNRGVEYIIHVHNRYFLKTPLEFLGFLPQEISDKTKLHP